MKSKEVKKFTYQLTVKESHIDMMGHMNNATYLQILEDARWELITQQGYGLDHIKKVGNGPVILQIEMKFLKEISLRQNLTVETLPISYEGKIGKLKQSIFNEQGELCFESIFTFALFDLRTRKIITPTKEWLSAIGLG